MPSPSCVSAWLDYRLLPEADQEQFLHKLRRIRDNDVITIQALTEMPPLLPSSIYNPFYQHLSDAIQRPLSEAEVASLMVPYINDTGLFRSSGCAGLCRNPQRH